MGTLPLEIKKMCARTGLDESMDGDEVCVQNKKTFAISTLFLILQLSNHYPLQTSSLY